MFEKVFNYLPALAGAAYIFWVIWKYYAGDTLSQFFNYEPVKAVGQLKPPTTVAEVKRENLDFRLREAQGHLHVAKQAQNPLVTSSAENRIKLLKRHLSDHNKKMREEAEKSEPVPSELTAEEQMMRTAEILGDHPRYEDIADLDKAIAEQERFALNSEHSGDTDRVEVHRSNAAALRKERESRFS